MRKALQHIGQIRQQCLRRFVRRRIEHAVLFKEQERFILFT